MNSLNCFASNKENEFIIKESSVIRTGYSASLTEKNVSNLIPDLELAYGIN